MTDLQRYLKSEYRDPEYQAFQLTQRNALRFGDFLGPLGWGGLCLFIAFFLY